MKLPIATKTSAGRSIPLNPERLVNLYAEAAPDNSRSGVVVHGTPGNSLFIDLSAGFIRGAYAVYSLNRLFVVRGLTLYEILSDGLSVTRGTIGGSGRVGMADNGTQLVITSVGISYVFTFATNTLVAITDSDFPNSRTVSFKGGYFVFVNSQVGSRGQFFISNIYDGSDFDALDFATAEYAPDNTVREFVDHDQLVLFGQKTVEFWYQLADPDFPFAPQQGAVIEKGLGARWSVAKVDNSVIFVDDSGIVRRLDGYTPVRISTHEVEYAISKGPWKTDDDNSIEGAFAWSYIEEGHEFYILTVPGTCTKVYDAATGLWHDRVSRDKDVWRYGFYANIFGKHLVFDSFNGKVYEQSLDVYEEDGTPITSELIFPQLQEENRRIIVHRLQLDMEVAARGVSLVSTAPDVTELTFAQKNSSFASGTVFGAAYGNGLWVAVGSGGKIATSENGESWSQETSPFGGDTNNAVAYGNGVWVVVGGNDGAGDGPIASSTNGSDWTIRSVASPNPDRWGVGYGAGLFVAVGSSGVIDTSPNGVTWTNRTSSFGSTLINDVLYNGSDLFVATGDTGKLATSPDGITWTQRTSSFGSTNILGVAYGNDVWVIVGGSNKIATSTNGTSWTQRTSGFTSGNINSVHFGGGLFIAVADNGEMRYSSDGVTWTALTSSFGGSSDIEDIFHNGAYFIATGGDQKIAKSTLFQSAPVATQYTGDRSVTLDVSGNTRTYDLTQAWRSSGDTGEFGTRVIWRRLGQHRNFTPKIQISAPIKRAIFAAYADIELCD